MDINPETIRGMSYRKLCALRRVKRYVPNANEFLCEFLWCREPDYSRKLARDIASGFASGTWKPGSNVYEHCHRHDFIRGIACADHNLSMRGIDARKPVRLWPLVGGSPPLFIMQWAMRCPACVPEIRRVYYLSR